MKKRVADMMVSRNSMIAAAVLSIIIAAVILSAAILTYPGIPAAEGIDSMFSNVTVLVLNQSGTPESYLAYVATTPTEQQQGYMNATSIGDCKGYPSSYDTPCIGMIFEFTNNSNECFWMKNTKLPLKQAWISNSVVTYIYNATPYSTAAICHTGEQVLETAINRSIYVGERILVSPCPITSPRC